MPEVTADLRTQPCGDVIDRVERCLLWQADETELITASPVRPGGILDTDPGLAEVWWATLGTSLRTLAAQATTRMATPQTVLISQERVTAAVERVFPGYVKTRTAHPGQPGMQERLVSVRVTRHGTLNPNAAVNNPNSSITYPASKPHSHH
jgi:hypothetical protein